jgi:hypothetical protein
VTSQPWRGLTRLAADFASLAAEATVRCACAALHLGTGRPFSSLNERANRRNRIVHLGIPITRQPRPSPQHRSEPVRGRRGPRHFAQSSGGPTPGFAAGGRSVLTGALAPPAVGRFVLVVVTAPAVIGSASRVSTVSAETPRPSQRSPSRCRPPAGTSDRPRALHCPASQYRLSPSPSRELTTPTRPRSGCPSFVGVPRQPQPAPFPFGRT